MRNRRKENTPGKETGTITTDGVFGSFDKIVLNENAVEDDPEHRLFIATRPTGRQSALAASLGIGEEVFAARHTVWIDRTVCPLLKFHYFSNMKFPRDHAQILVELGIQASEMGAIAGPDSKIINRLAKESSDSMLPNKDGISHFFFTSPYMPILSLALRGIPVTP